MRPVGKQIRAVLSASQALGHQATASDLFHHARLENLTGSTRTRVCRRAVKYGLMQADDTTSPVEFIALPGWQTRVNLPHISNAEFIRPVKVIHRTYPRINSVWALAL